MAEQMVRIAAVLKLAAIALALALRWRPAAEAAACRIAVLGDSLTSSYGLDLADGFPARLEQRARASRATTARCSMPASPATPRPAVSRASTGCSPTSRAT